MKALQSLWVALNLQRLGRHNHQQPRGLYNGYSPIECLVLQQHQYLKYQIKGTGFQIYTSNFNF